MKAEKAENREEEQANIMVPPVSMGSPKNSVDRPEAKNSGIKLFKQRGGSPTGPPLGKRNKSPLKVPSSSGENLCQEGGTDKEQGAPKTKKPSIRESARGPQIEGRERRPKGTTRDMAKAMEKWLKSGDTDGKLVKSPKR